MNPIDKLTMEFMSNKIFNEYVIQTKEENQGKYEKEERFYKKRLYSLYKELFKNKTHENQTIVHAFKNFNQIAMDHFKQEDKYEIVQTELGNLPLEKKVGFDESVPLDEFTNKLEDNQQRDIDAFQNTNSVKTCTLDNFIIRKPNQKKNTAPPPQKIVVNLKTKNLQNKNVPKKIKKKNINNKYEESPEKNAKEIKK